jgi:hypothetical protein
MYRRSGGARILLKGWQDFLFFILNEKNSKVNKKLIKIIKKYS